MGDASPPPHEPGTHLVDGQHIPVSVTAFTANADLAHQSGAFGRLSLTQGAGCGLLLHPDGQFRKIWDLVQVFALAYVAVLVPFRTGFEVDLDVLSAAWFIEMIVDIYFIADIVLNFRTGYFDDGSLQMDPSQIARNYLTGWLTIDIVSCLPITYIMQLVEAFADDNEDGQSGVNVKVFKILRLLVRLTSCSLGFTCELRR
jgi:hypothetical protein